MAATFNPAARACGAQDCPRSTGQPGHPLCRAHYQEFQQGAISPCPNHPQVYKPAQFAQCRECGIAKTVSNAVPTFKQKKGNGWGQQKPETPETPHPPETLVKAVQLVRRNMTAYEKDCANHETNTIQYLIMPMLRALGWDEGDPSQVKREFRPKGKNRYGNSIAVDIALLQNGNPKIFIEAKRLDREYNEEYRNQTEKYAAFLNEGEIATLTNGRHWLIHRITNRQVQLEQNIDLAAGQPVDVARQMQANFGRAETAAVPSPTGWQQQPKAQTPGPTAGELIRIKLREYRQKTTQQTGKPTYTIVRDEAIELLAEAQPRNPEQLSKIKGIGPSILASHGTAILDIIREAKEQAAAVGRK